MSKHTKGPWKIGTPGPNGCYTIGTERGLMTAMIAHSICEPDQVEEAKANAALIAAAPELLEALQRTLYQPLTGNPSYERLVEFWEYEKIQGRGEADDMLFALATIEKALGR